MSRSSLDGSAADLAARAVAFEDYEADERWDIVRELQRRGDSSTFEVVADLAGSEDSRKVAVAVDVLGQLGFPKGRPWLEQSLPIVLSVCDAEDSMILDAAIVAVGHLGDQRGLRTVLAHRHAADARVRLAVACALPSVAGNPMHIDAIDAVIELMADVDDEVRDWATFGLGVLTDVDGPKVRDALMERLHDHGGDTAGEALVGLARRSDRRILPLLRDFLEDPDAGNLTIEAAAALGDPSLVGPLERLKQSGWAERDVRGSILDDAIAACRSPR